MTQTIKDRLEELKKPKWDYEKSDYPYYVKKDKENVAFNAGVDACLPLLEEVEKEMLGHFTTVLVKIKNNPGSVDEFIKNVEIARTP